MNQYPLSFQELSLKYFVLFFVILIVNLSLQMFFSMHLIVFQSDLCFYLNLFDFVEFFV